MILASNLRLTFVIRGSWVLSPLSLNMADLVNPRDLGKDRYTSDGRDIFEYFHPFFPFISLVANILKTRPPGPKAKINAGITLKENADLQENQNPSIDQHSLEDTNLPNRPAFAKIGVSVDLRANLFEISLSDSQQLFPYKAEFDQRLQDNKRQTGWFFQTILQELPELKSMGDGVATDYASLLVTSAKIDLGPTNRKTFTMGYYKRGGQGDPVRAGAKPFEFTLSSLPPITSADLSRYVGSSPAILGESESTDSEVIRTLNVIIAGHPNKDPGVYQGGQGRLFRYPTRSEASSFDLQGGLIAVRGYFYSVRFATLRVLLNVHGQCNPFYKVGDARALMQEFKDLVGEKAGALEGFFHLLKVRTSYMKANGKPITNFRTVVGLSAGNANDTKFKQTGRQPEATISVAQYFSSRKFGAANRQSKF